MSSRFRPYLPRRQRVLIALMDHENYVGPAVDEAETQLLDVEDAITTLMRDAR